MFLEEENMEDKQATSKPLVDFSTFDSLEMVVGEIKACRKHENADKILVFDVDFGNETRQILSGVAAYYKSEELVGKKVAAVLNLKPRVIRGLESKGMLLSFVDNKDGKEKSQLITSDMPVGSKIC